MIQKLEQYVDNSAVTATMKHDQERVKNLIMDTVKLVCRNGLSYNFELKVQGLIGITLDQEEVFIIHMDERMTCADDPSIVSDAAAALCHVAGVVSDDTKTTWPPDLIEKVDAVVTSEAAVVVMEQAEETRVEEEDKADNNDDEGCLTIAEIDGSTEEQPATATTAAEYAVATDPMSFVVIKSDNLPGIDVVTDVVEEQVETEVIEEMLAVQASDRDLSQMIANQPPPLPPVSSIKSEQKSVHSESMCGDSDDSDEGSTGTEDDEISSEESSPMKQPRMSSAPSINFPSSRVSGVGTDTLNASTQSVVQRFVQDSYMRGGATATSSPWTGASPCDFYSAAAWRSLPGILSGVVPVGHSSATLPSSDQVIF